MVLRAGGVYYIGEEMMGEDFQAVTGSFEPLMLGRKSCSCRVLVAVGWS